MAVEDFNDYTEVDPQGAGRTSGNLQWNEAGDHLDAVLWMDAVHESRLYKDKGENFFSNFEHKVDGYWDAVSAGNWTQGAIWMLSNYLDDHKYHDDNNISYLSVCFVQSNLGAKKIRLNARDGATLYGDQYACSLDTWYYLTIERNGTTLTCKIYSDSARTNLLDTLSVTCPTTLFRYIYACNCRNNNTTNNMTVDVENLDLQITEYTISGVTRDANGDPLGSCTVWLFKTSDKSYQQQTISDAVTGAYSFTVTDNTIEYFIRAYKDGTPNVFGTTDDNLMGS